MTSEEAELAKVLILRHNCKALCGCIVPNGCIRLATKSNLMDTGGTGKDFLKSRYEPMAKVFIEEKFHAVEPDASRILWTASNSRAARMCCGVRVGKSAKSSTSVIPPSKYSSTS